MELFLTRADRKILMETLEHAVAETSSEAHHTSTRDYRKMLNHELECLRGILQQLRDEEIFETESLDSELELEIDEPGGRESDAYLLSVMMGPH